MSTNSSPNDVAVLTGEPAGAAQTPQPPRPAPPTPAGEDGATTPGGPTMVLLFTAGFVTYKVWRFRRRRANRR